MDLTIRQNFKKGMLVDIIEDKKYDKEYVIRGYIDRILSKENNSKGIKVKLHTGEKGRVYNVPTKDEVKKNNFIFFNKFLYEDIFIIYDKKNKKNVYFKTNTNKKIAYLFSRKDFVNEYINEKKLNPKIYIHKKIYTQNGICNYFKNSFIDYFILNNEKQVSEKKLEQIELYFKQNETNTKTKKRT